MKKSFKAILSIVTALMLVLSACGNGNSSIDQKEKKKESSSGSGDYVPEKLTVQFVPSQNADTLEAKAKPLEKLLSDKIGIPVEVSVSTNYNTIVEAMKSKKVDVGFLPPTAYTLAKNEGAADLLLQAQRFGVNEDGSDSDQLVDHYKSIFVVKKDSDIEDIKDLKGKKIALQDVSSTAGYTFPVAELLDAGINPLKEMNVTTVKGHDQAIISVLNGDVDAAAVFQDARNIVKGDQPNVFKDTKVIADTENIPNDTISVRSDLDSKWREKLSQAFKDIVDSKEGHDIISEVYSHENYTDGDDQNFEIVRKYNKKVNDIQ
ncbi:phosphate/phosphite/phosphonate ABC transporter substrate-binding protein [Staphylococcus felis]|uniref:phosphate/phosphite/phosphonate ABC transporter substrate-binding protein n=1 Tax=Staphylococcus felis TaxID=46127 RepID=UPI00237C2A8C|nr:phosphate/phosphite/phosphonate ABC transporter substrate-binding protein [Staphylococcus felis]